MGARGAARAVRLRTGRGGFVLAAQRRRVLQRRGRLGEGAGGVLGPGPLRRSHVQHLQRECYAT
jgi:hypothetical protein